MVHIPGMQNRPASEEDNMQPSIYAQSDYQIVLLVLRQWESKYSVLRQTVSKIWRRLRVGA